MHAAASEDPEMATLLMWDRKTKERLRKRYMYTCLEFISYTNRGGRLAELLP